MKKLAIVMSVILSMTLVGVTQAEEIDTLRKEQLVEEVNKLGSRGERRMIPPKEPELVLDLGHKIVELLQERTGKFYSDPVTVYPVSYDKGVSKGHRIIKFSKIISEEQLDKINICVFNEEGQQEVDYQLTLLTEENRTVIQADPIGALQENKSYYLVIHDRDNKGSDKPMRRIYVKPFYIDSDGDRDTVVQTKDGYIFDKQSGAIIKYMGTEEYVEVPEEIEGIKVRTIGEEAFIGNKTIKQLSLPYYVETVGNRAFKDCENLETIQLTMVNSLGNQVFQGCGIRELNLSDYLTSIGDQAFAGNQLEVVKFGKELHYLGKGAFEDNKIIEVDLEITNISSIPASCFTRNQLERILLPSTVKEIKERAFSNQSGNGYCDTVLELSSVERIENNAFSNFDLNGATVRLGNKLRFIAYASFLNSNAGAFENLENTNITEIREHTFAGNNMKDLKLPKSLKKIYNRAIYNVPKLSRVQLFNSTELEEQAIQTEQVIRMVGMIGMIGMN